MKEKIQLSDHFSYSRLIKFVIPSIVMMIFTSIYGVVDGLFVSNLVGKSQFAAINLIFPLIMILGGFGFMLGVGGTAIVANTLGMGEKKRANEYFTFIIISTAAMGVILASLGIYFAGDIASLFGAEGEMLEYCVLYCRIVLCALPFFMLQNSFQNFFITAEKPKLGLFVTVAAGVTNIILDALFIGILGWGLAGAAAATALSQFVGGVIPIAYFASKNNSLLRFCRTGCYWRVLLNACVNGSSELLSNISMSLVTIFYNFQLMRLAGEDGIAAYGVMMYVGFIFIAVYIGFVIGAAPIIGFHYGAGNSDELHSIRTKSNVIVFTLGVIMFSLALVLSVPLCKLFVGYDEGLYRLTLRGYCINAVSYLVCGFNIFGSSLFTALNNGLISAVISFMRTIVFQISAVLLLPLILGLDGVWASIILAEALAALVTATFIGVKKKKYNY